MLLYSLLTTEFGKFNQGGKKKTKLLPWRTIDCHQGDLCKDSMSQKHFCKVLKMQLCQVLKVPKETTRDHNSDPCQESFN